MIKFELWHIFKNSAATAFGISSNDWNIDPFLWRAHLARADIKMSLMHGTRLVEAPKANFAPCRFNNLGSCSWRGRGSVTENASHEDPSRNVMLLPGYETPKNKVRRNLRHPVTRDLRQRKYYLTELPTWRRFRNVLKRLLLRKHVFQLFEQVLRTQLFTAYCKCLGKLTCFCTLFKAFSHLPISRDTFKATTEHLDVLKYLQ